MPQAPPNSKGNMPLLQHILPYLDQWTRGWINHEVCDVWLMWCQTYGYLHGRRVSPLLGRYQIILLGDRGTRVWTPCLELYYYLADSIDLYRPSRCLRSSNCHLLAVPSCAKSSFALQAFCVSSPNYWNSLPLHIRSSDILASFKSRLKSHLFSSAYHV